MYSKTSLYRIDLKSLKSFYQYCGNKLANIKQLNIADYSVGKLEKYKLWMKDIYEKSKNLSFFHC